MRLLQGDHSLLPNVMELRREYLLDQLAIDNFEQEMKQDLYDQMLQHNEVHLHLNIIDKIIKLVFLCSSDGGDPFF